MIRVGRVLLGGAALTLAAGSAAAVWTAIGPGSQETSADTLGDYWPVLDFDLVERSGRRVTLADLRGKVWVANFIYTECTETCPVQSLQVSRLQAEFVASSDLRLISITVDPKHDTPEVLSRYADRYQADPERWLFLTGPKEAIYRLAKDGFKLSVADAGASARSDDPRFVLAASPAFASHGSKGLIIHSSRFVLVDRRARIRAYHRTDDPASLARLRDNLRAVLAQ